jgi:hypothetical protein
MTLVIQYPISEYRTAEYRTSGRRGRKGFAEDAKGIPKDIPVDDFIKNTANVTVIWSYIAIKTIPINFINSKNLKSLSVFFRYSFASSAKPLRPLRPEVRYSAVGY